MMTSNSPETAEAQFVADAPSAGRHVHYTHARPPRFFHARRRCLRAEHRPVVDARAKCLREHAIRMASIKTEADFKPKKV